MSRQKKNNEPDYRGHDLNWFEAAVYVLGGVKAAAKKMRVTQKDIQLWLRLGRVNSVGLAKRVGADSGIAWELIYSGPFFG